MCTIGGERRGERVRRYSSLSTRTCGMRIVVNSNWTVLAEQPCTWCVKLTVDIVSVTFIPLLSCRLPESWRFLEAGNNMGPCYVSETRISSPRSHGDHQSFRVDMELVRAAEALKVRVAAAEALAEERGGEMERLSREVKSSALEAKACKERALDFKALVNGLREEHVRRAVRVKTGASCCRSRCSWGGHRPASIVTTVRMHVATSRISHVKVGVSCFLFRCCSSVGTVPLCITQPHLHPPALPRSRHTPSPSFSRKP